MKNLVQLDLMEETRCSKVEHLALGIFLTAWLPIFNLKEIHLDTTFSKYQYYMQTSFVD